MGGQRGFGGFGGTGSGGFDEGGLTGLELTAEEEIALSLGIDSTDWVTADTRAGSERFNAWQPMYVERKTGSTGLDLRVGGLFFSFTGPSDAILGDQEAVQNFVLSAANIGRSIPANVLEVNDVLEWDSWGIFPVIGTTPNLVIGFRLGSTTLVATPAITPSGANHLWRFRGKFRFSAVGAGGAGVGRGMLTQGNINSAANASTQMAQSGSAGSPSTSIATNASKLPAIFVDRATGAEDTNSIVMYGFDVHVHKHFLASA